MEDQTHIKILEILYNLYKKKPTGVLSTLALSRELAKSVNDTQGALIYLKEKDLIKSFQNIDGRWMQKISALGIDELEKNRKENQTPKTSEESETLYI